MSSDDKSVSRRSILKQAGATGALGLAGTAGCSGDGGGGDGDDEYPALGNYPIDGDTATFGFNVPLSGPYSSEGRTNSGRTNWPSNTSTTVVAGSTTGTTSRARASSTTR